MATNAIAVLQTARQVNIAAAAAAQVRARVRAAPMHLRVRHTRVRALSTRATADGNAFRRTTTKMVSATAAPISRVRRASIARARVTIPAATASNVTTVSQIARQVSIAEAAAAPVRGHARAVPTSHRIRHTRVRAPSI